MKRMEYARSLGLAKDGPGRPSRAALDAIQAKRDEGYVFDDDVPTGPTVKREAPARMPVTRNPAMGTGENVGSMADTRERYALSAKFTGQDSKGKTQTVGTPTVCRRTGYSILGCYCTGPGHEVLVASMEVIIVTEKG
jgi:hypothetical protein